MIIKNEKTTYRSPWIELHVYKKSLDVPNTDINYTETFVKEMIRCPKCHWTTEYLHTNGSLETMTKKTISIGVKEIDIESDKVIFNVTMPITNSASNPIGESIDTTKLHQFVNEKALKELRRHWDLIPKMFEPAIKNIKLFEEISKSVAQKIERTNEKIRIAFSSTSTLPHFSGL
ncbi:MAG: hypothetical protein HZB67_03075 [Candidatus Aenigmarchaeota archaeon]|nr:hypothetical protein [Candidatus Aenigmarchaeota archaeon]